MRLSVDDGSKHKYVVTSVEQYRKSALPYERIFRQRCTPSVVLVTCGGEYKGLLLAGGIATLLWHSGPMREGPSQVSVLGS
jgi:hypothetical protein